MTSNLLTLVGSTNFKEIHKHEWSPQNWEMYLQRRISQHYVTCCVTRFVTWSHRTVTCTREVLWEAWYCPVTVYCSRISLIFSEVIWPKNSKQHRITSSLKCVTAYMTTCGKFGITSVCNKRAVFLSITIRKYFQQTLTKYSWIL